MKHFKRFFFVYLGLLFLALSIASSYLRFVVLSDYKVSYFYPCDPRFESCFVDGCYEDICLEELAYYKKVERKAKNLLILCDDKNLLTCEKAGYCLEGEDDCLVENCLENNSESVCASEDINQRQSQIQAFSHQMQSSSLLNLAFK